MSISLRLNEEDATLIKKYATMHNLSLSELIRQAVMEKIENEYDLAAYQKSMDEYTKDPTTYTLNEVEKELGII